MYVELTLKTFDELQLRGTGADWPSGIQGICPVALGICPRMPIWALKMHHNATERRVIRYIGYAIFLGVLKGILAFGASLASCHNSRAESDLSPPLERHNVAML